MHQMDLFDTATTETDAPEAETFSIGSGRVGPIRFGSTDASYTLTRDVLAALAMLSDDAGTGAA